MKYLIGLLALFLLLFNGSCKKGENDPAFSLASRKARLAGDYHIKVWHFSVRRTDEMTPGYWSEFIRTIGDNKGIQYTISSGGSENFRKEWVYDQLDFSFTKDGKWTKVISGVEKWDGSEPPTEPGDFPLSGFYEKDETVTESGTWSFLQAKKDEFKNKERILLTLNERHTVEKSLRFTYEWGGGTAVIEKPTKNKRETFSGHQISTTYEIDQLAKDEIILLKHDGEGEKVIIDGTVWTGETMEEGNTKIHLVAK